MPQMLRLAARYGTTAGDDVLACFDLFATDGVCCSWLIVALQSPMSEHVFNRMPDLTWVHVSCVLLLVGLVINIFATPQGSSCRHASHALETAKESRIQDAPSLFAPRCVFYRNLRLCRSRGRPDLSSISPSRRARERQ